MKNQVITVIISAVVFLMNPSFAQASKQEIREAFETEFILQTLQQKFGKNASTTRSSEQFRGEYFNPQTKEWECEVVNATVKLNQLWNIQYKEPGACIETRGCTLRGNVDQFNKGVPEEDYWQYLKCVQNPNKDEQ